MKYFTDFIDYVALRVYCARIKVITITVTRIWGKTFETSWCTKLSDTAFILDNFTSKLTVVNRKFTWRTLILLLLLLRYNLSDFIFAYYYAVFICFLGNFCSSTSRVFIILEKYHFSCCLFQKEKRVFVRHWTGEIILKYWFVYIPNFLCNLFV